MSDRIVTESGERSGFIGVSDGKITDIGDDVSGFSGDCRVLDFRGRIIAPGLIELHSHGGGGHSFSDSDPSAVAAACDFHLSHGTTTILPTVTAGPFGRMAESARNIRVVMEGKMTRANVAGVHMEGPYLSKKQAGAQCPAYITLPDEREYLPFLDELGPAVKRWDFAPENDPEGKFTRELVSRGIIASAGHTDATYAQMRPALREGLSLVTHLYSCTSTVTRDHGFRSPGVIETAFLLDGLYAEIIADGRHLPPEMIKMIVKIKGRERVALITDSLAIAGTDVTSGTMSGTDFIVEDGVCKLTDRSAFAGSVATSDRLLRVLVHDCGISLADAVYMASTTPADIIGLREKGRIEVGADADFTVFTDALTVDSVFVAGKKAV